MRQRHHHRRARPRAVGHLAVGSLALVLAGLSGCRSKAASPTQQIGRLQEELAATYRRGTAEEATAAARVALAAQGDFDVARAGFDRAFGDSLAGLATALWQQTPDDGSGIRLLLLGYRPTFGNPERHRWWAFGGSILPHRLDGRTCVVAIPMNEAWQRTGVGIGSTSLRNLMSPCLFWRRYGTPGAGIMGWLETTGFRPLALGGWLDDASRIDWRRLGNPFADWGDFGPPDMPVIRRSPWSVVSVLTRIRQPPYRLGPEFVRCLAGREGACQQAALSAVDDEPSGQGLADRNRNWWAGSPDWEYWIANLIRYEGDDRFRRLWKSDSRLSASFEAVYGIGLDEGVRRWAELGRADREPIRVGVTVPPPDALAGVGWFVLLAALVIAGSRRRLVAG